MPELGEWTEEKVKEKFPGMWKDYSTEETGMPPKPELPKPPANIKDFVTPNYTKRDEFENVVFKQIGMNPFKFDIMAHVNKVTSENMENMFNQVFGNQILWADRNKLNKKQFDFWDEQLKAARANLYNRTKSFIDQKTGEYKWMMDKFDMEAKAYQTALEKHKTALNTWAEKRRTEQLKAEKPEDITKLSDFKWAYNLAKQKIPKLTPLEFRRDWEKPTGGLTEGGIIKSIDDLSYLVDDPNWKTKAYNKYLEYKNQGLSREEAFNKVRLEMSTSEKETKIIGGMTFEKQKDGNWKRIK